MKTEYKIGIAVGFAVVGAVVGGCLYRMKKKNTASESEKEIEISGETEAFSEGGADE